MEIQIDANSQTPIYKQLVESIQKLIDAGIYQKGKFLPSMNELANKLQISKETVKKAYSVLRDTGFIESTQGKGFYVTNNGKNKIKILLLFDKISTYKQVLYNSFATQIEDIAETTIRLHNQDIDLFEYFIEQNLDYFDYYLITPHFPLDSEIQKRAITCLKKIPNRKLIILDRYINLKGNFGAVFQDIENDGYNGLKEAVQDLKKYKRLNIISKGSLYAPIIKKGIEKFCIEFGIPFKVLENIETKKIQKNQIYLILNSQLDTELIELAHDAKKQGCKIGKDIGIISYNESPINEIVLNGLTVLSTDFKKMGELAAEMIQTKSFKKIRCDFHLIRRTTF
ncbi:GntR family transcriptional regulator [Mariniphaga sediminis]|uniref:GntR family transcriptional regulator n=1 Tax=Mariniphaga sediminis TaxID=1628158 RepID=UPI0035641133